MALTDRDIAAANTKRMYQEIWEAVKKTGRCTIECNPRLFERVKKAVIKEKWLDIPFKVENDTRRYTLEVVVNTTKKQMTFFLHKSIGLDDV